MQNSWWQQRERGSVLAMKLMTFLSLRLGRRIALLLLFPICLYFLLFSPSSRRASRQYLRRALDRPLQWRDLFRHHYWFAVSLLDRTYLLAGRTDEFQVTRFGAAMMDDVMSRRGQCLLLGAHFGSFEMARVMAMRNYQLDVNMLMYAGNAKKVGEVAASVAGPYPTKVLPLGGVHAMLQAKDCVDAGGTLGMLGDRAFGNEKVVSVPFFGSQITLPAGPFLIAKALKIPVVMFFVAYRGGNRYDEHLELLSEEIVIDPRHARRDLQKWATAYATRLEHHCRQTPYNWFNFYDYWNEAASVPAEVATEGAGV